jgi:hypothetical protein
LRFDDFGVHDEDGTRANTGASRATRYEQGTQKRGPHSRAAPLIESRLLLEVVLHAQAEKAADRAGLMLTGALDLIATDHLNWRGCLIINSANSRTG